MSNVDIKFSSSCQPAEMSIESPTGGNVLAIDKTGVRSETEFYGM